jgi:osmotically-inducible protein OsmY
MAIHRVIPAVLLLAAGAWGQAGVARPKAQAPARVTAQPRASDARIEAAIRAKLAQSKKISQDKFQVHVQGGVATLEGKTEVVQHKGSATRMAKSAGALAVNNKIQVSEAAKRKSAGNLEEGRRRAQIKRGDQRSAVP